MVERDWSFARRPFWVFSHLFAVSVVTLFIFLGFWQLSRHYERADLNETIRSRSEPPALDLDTLDLSDPAALDYQLVSATGEYVDDDLVRVANRSQGGAGGEHLVALFRLDDGRLVLVNRGFIPLDAAAEPAPAGRVTLDGWLRISAEKGLFGATDDGEGPLVPRLNVDDIATRVDGALLPVSLQLAPATGAPPATATFPDPVPLPDLGGGPHLSYMGQWWVFATLGVIFYIALLRRNAASTVDTTPVPVQPDTVSASVGGGSDDS